MERDSEQETIEKTNDPQSWFFEKINKNNKHQINNKVLLIEQGTIFNTL